MMAVEGAVLKALKSKTKGLTLDNRQLKELPVSIGRLTFLQSFSAKNNDLQTLPEEIAQLSSLTYLNLGGNCLETILPCTSSLTELITLHLFRNRISILPEHLTRSLSNLTTLNLNDNNLISLPPHISLLYQLKHLSLANNSITQLPKEIGVLSQLVELHLEGNKISNIPNQIGKLSNLRKLLMQSNQLVEIPSTIGGCTKLLVLDVSCNKIELFPSELSMLKLKEFYFEHNPLIPYIPVPSEQQEEVLPLREITSRMIVKELKSNNHLLSAMVNYYPDLEASLSKAGTCSVCGDPFISSWLQCALFKPARELLPLRNRVPGQSSMIPLTASLCSYKCFNSEGHEFFGIAAPPI